MMEDPQMMGHTLIAVHGLPTGQGGEAAKVGKYPHAWLELVGADLVYDTVAAVMVPKGLYYQAGEIEYALQYTVEEVRQQMLEHETYGPWDQHILNRDAEIDQMIGGAE